jgi:hypothetical protein
MSSHPIEGAKEKHVRGIVLDIELDANLAQVVLDDRLAIIAPGLTICEEVYLAGEDASPENSE